MIYDASDDEHNRNEGKCNDVTAPVYLRDVVQENAEQKQHWSVPDIYIVSDASKISEYLCIKHVSELSEIKQYEQSGINDEI